MRRLVRIPIKGAAAVGLWALGALCVAAEVRQPGFWCDKVDALRGQRLTQGSGERVIGVSADLSAKPGANLGEQKDAESSQSSIQNSQNNEVAAEQQAAQIPPQKPPQKGANDAHTRQIVISIPDRRLALLEDGQVVKVYPVAVGASETPSPDGEFTIINHAVDPTYRHDGQEIGPGKSNPLGTRWMGLSLKGYGIHGTNRQSSVGKAASHGCFRMKKKDVEELYSRVQVGDAVSIRGERDELTASLFTDGANANPAVVAGKTETQIASAAAAGATGDEERQ